MSNRVCHFSWLLVLTGVSLAGCSRMIVDRTDRNVYRLIEDRQRAALGEASDLGQKAEIDDVTESGRMYDFEPHSLPPGVPPEFLATGPSSDVGRTDVSEKSAVEEEPMQTAYLSPSIFTEAQQKRVTVVGLSDALEYASLHGRTLQDAKEELYLAALDLSLERHLWTPQFVASVQGDVDYSDGGNLNDEVRTLTFLSDVAVSQRLPFGGDVTARIISNLVRDIADHVTTGESGSVILEANIPLLRGAGRVAYESRYSAERALIYAVRTYERFRRSFLVQVASDYFNLQSLKTAIDNTYESYRGREQDWQRADFISRMGRNRTIFDAPRAKSTLRAAEAALVSAKEQYETALDRFKVFVGMPVGALLDVVEQEADEESKSLDALLPPVDRAVAEDVAIRYRLDLLTSADGVDDARRGVINARNAILPDLNLAASWATNSNADHLSAYTFNPEQNTWHGGLQLNVDDRKSERNAYRAALINVRRAERDHEQFADNVRADVRRALRRIDQQENLRNIQTLNVKENEFRLDAAKAQFALGKSTNQDVVDADNDLLAARNQLARAVAAFRIAILDFRRDTGTLRLGPTGRWLPGGEGFPEAQGNADGEGP